MTPEQYQRAMQVIDAVIDCEPSRREFVLNQACVPDDPLRGDIEKLLASYEPAASFMEESPMSVIADLRGDEEAHTIVGKHVGPYIIAREIGRGGMGAVYLAERDDDVFRRQVAIKLIKRGMDTDFILSRFRNERQILANLNHPNIARLYSGGTTEDGLPFFVMEYVEGIPIDEYCGTRNLSVPEKMKLFRSVCAAVQYAHQNLIVHRDLKPTNILVTAEGTPKLLDFGIAKLLTAEINESGAEMTATEFRVMTPEYASPEQVRGLPVTTATDVYSLGVILYELLTGRRPYLIKSRRPDELSRMICEQEPARPSNAISDSGLGNAESKAKGDVTSGTNPQSSIPNPKSLRGDIDNIVLKAMRKDPGRRYVSVDQLSEDIRRHLENRPVHARKDTFAYSGWSFIKRNKILVAAGALLVLSLLGGIVATTRQSRVARAQKARAERRFNDVHKLANSFLFEFHDSIKDVPGTLAARQLLLNRGLEYLDSLAEEAAGDKALQSELAIAYDKIGALTFDVEKSLESHRKALMINQTLVASEPGNTSYRRQLATSYGFLADLMKEKGDARSALENYQHSLALVAELSAGNPLNLEYLFELGEGYNDVGASLAEVGQPGAALENYRQAQDVADVLEKANPDNLTYRHRRALNYIFMGHVLSDNGDYPSAVANLGKALTISENLLATDPTNRVYRLTLWSVQRHLGEISLRMKSPQEALSHFQTALALIEPLANADPTDAGHGHHLSITYFGLAQAFAHLGQTKPALQSYRKAMAISENLLAKDPHKAETSDDLAQIYAGTGSLLTQIKEIDEGLELLRKAVALQEQISSKDSGNARLRSELADAYAALGAAQLQLALTAKGSREQKKALGEETRSCYQKSLNVWQEMRRTGTLMGADLPKIEEVARQITRVDHLLHP